MKKTMVALAASLCALSAHAADPIDFNVQLKGEVPSQDYFEVSVRGDWDPENVAFKIPEGWDGKETDALRELQWNIRSSYGLVKMKVGSEGQAIRVENSSGDDFNITYSTTSPNGGWAVRGSKGRTVEVLNAADAKKGDWAGLRLKAWSEKGAPASGEYVGTLPVVFETGFEG